MTLSAGDKLGVYEILAHAGAGGMGEVYKARDTRLDRTVALKVLTTQSERFEREARTVASLNHPNICVLFDIGSHEDTPFMVMEYLEGETLADRLDRGALKLEEALRFAVQIGDALDRAHRAGVTHRDIKPGNIMLTRDGAKVLDFGLAKIAEKAAAATPSDATLTKVLTGEHTVMGTPQYMAPELFEGKPADARSDIWAFGAVLYETATAKKAFEGSSYSSLVGAILAAEPKPMQPFAPAWLDRVARRCLAKDPEERYQSIRDVVLDLRNPPPVETMVVKRNWQPWAVAAACLALAVTAAAGWAISAARRTAPATVSVAEINPPEAGHFARISTSGGSAISPDGRALAYIAVASNGQTLLHVRRIDALDARAIPGTEDAGRPFWSPDSKSIAFVGGGKLKRIDLAGGAPTILCDSTNARGGTWSEDGVILFAERLSGLMRVQAGGGERVPVTTTKPETGESAHYYPQFLPGGKRFLYLVRGTLEKQGIYIASLDGKTPARRVLETPLEVRYDTLTRSLLYVDSGTVMARRLEIDPPRLAGDPRRVAAGVAFLTISGYVDFSVSADGALFYRPGTAVGNTQFVWFDRGGRKLETFAEPFESGSPYFRLSPDGARVAYDRFGAGQQSDIWLVDIRRGASTRLTFQGGTFPQWTPDGKQIYYRCVRGICHKASDGSGEEEFESSSIGFPRAISPDSSTLLIGTNDILALRLGTGQKPQPWLQTPFREDDPAVSADGRWVAYESDESGRFETYVQGYPERRGKWQVSQAGGRFPHWRSDGRELYWRAPDGAVIAAPITVGPVGIETAKPAPLFRAPPSGFEWFEPDRTGKRFLLTEPVGGPARELPMVVVQNWPALAGVQR